MYKKIMLAAGVLIITLSFAPAAHAAVIYANSATGNDSTGTGSSTAPYATFSKAYTQANSGDTIELSGTFNWMNPAETATSSIYGFLLNKNLTIIGTGATSTIIEASSTQGTAATDVFWTASGKSVTLEDMTVRYGVGDATGSAGGITNWGTMALDNVLVTDNTLVGNGSYEAGGIYSYNNTSLTIASSTISNNTQNEDAGSYGAGGIFGNSGAAVTIIASTINGNSASNEASTSPQYGEVNPGGGIEIESGTLTMTNSTVTGNSTNTYGGGLNLYNTLTTLTNDTIAYNSAYDDYTGGIILNNDGAGDYMYIENTLVANNTGGDVSLVDTPTAANVVDNGYNIITSSDHNATWTAAGDHTGTQPSLNLESTLASNSAADGVQTLALDQSSVAQDAATTTANNGITVPGIDERGFYRYGLPDIGAYEYDGTSIPDFAPVLTVQTQIPSSVTASSATYSYTASFLDPVTIHFTSCENSPTISTSGLSSTSANTVTLSNLVGGETYECTLTYTDAYYTSNALIIGPFSIPVPQGGGVTGGGVLSPEQLSHLGITVISSSSPSISVPASTSSPVVASSTLPLLSLGMHDLKEGMFDVTVAALQRFLDESGFAVATSGPGSLGNETKFFGKLTKVALSAWQAAHAVSPAAGYYGPLTRKAMNAS